VAAPASNVILVGLGPHARRTYAPHMRKLGSRLNARLCAVVELASAREETESFLQAAGFAAERLYVPPFPPGGMPPEVSHALDGLVRRHGARGVIVSTEPLAHRAYVEYALDRGLSVLVDKPLTTRPGVAHDLAQARALWDDYAELRAAYRAARARNRVCVVINSHRRWHPGFRKAFELIADIRQRFGCPVTHVASEHCDGQWRLPAEIVAQDYHPYNRGYGKLSHSGYHSLDMAASFVKAGAVPSKAADSVAVAASFVLPAGFLRQLTRDDYRRVFGPGYAAACPRPDDELRAAVENFGEIDAHALVEFRRHDEVVATAQVDLRHNGFARRSWLRPGADLYKGNGRVRHERHAVVSGPFQTLYIESYQANDRHDRSGGGDLDRGGNNHFELVVYRNCAVTGDREPQRVYRLSELTAEAGFDRTGLHNEQLKEQALAEFLRFLAGELGEADLRSGIEGHELTARLMSLIYEAHATRAGGGPGWASAPL
jgi:predicted dehydrogenase